MFRTENFESDTSIYDLNNHSLAKKSCSCLYLFSCFGRRTPTNSFFLLQIKISIVHRNLIQNKEPALNTNNIVGNKLECSTYQNVFIKIRRKQSKFIYWEIEMQRK